jgi:hypothetical protein
MAAVFMQKGLSRKGDYSPISFACKDRYLFLYSSAFFGFLSNIFFKSSMIEAWGRGFDKPKKYYS